jgi:hypothetical protein
MERMERIVGRPRRRRGRRRLMVERQLRPVGGVQVRGCAVGHEGVVVPRFVATPSVAARSVAARSVATRSVAARSMAVRK